MGRKFKTIKLIKNKIQTQENLFKRIMKKNNNYRNVKIIIISIMLLNNNKK